MREYIDISQQHIDKSCELCATDIIAEKPKDWLGKNIIRIVFSVILFGIAFISGNNIYSFLLLILAALISGYEVIIRGLKKAVKKRQLDMNFLMTIASIGAFSIGHSEEGAAILLLFFIAETMEDYAGDRSRKAIQELIEILPESAHVIKKEKETKMHVHDVKVGDFAAVRPGEKIPLDGIVVEGITYVDQSPITGESLPVEKKKGDEVFAGTINKEGYIEIKVTRESEQSTVAKIKKLIEFAQMRKSHTERVVEKFAKKYTPAIVGLSIFIATVPHFVFNLEFSVWFYKALILLVVSCPCALAISTPVSMISAITGAYKKGILIKGGIFLESLRKIKTFYFDKTGTLSKGDIEVSDVILINKNATEEEVMSLAASLESCSQHAVGEAIVEKARQRNFSGKKVESFKNLGGLGIEGIIEKEKYILGSKTLFKNKTSEEVNRVINEIENNEKIPIILAKESEVIGIIALSDELRSEAKAVVANLKLDGSKVYMLTGDSESTARKISEELELDGYYSELLPDMKVDIVEKALINGPVVMIGDGINDAPALKMASVGIAMGGASDIALETADIVLMGDDLKGIIYLKNLSSKTLSVIKENISLAIGIKLGFAILAIIGIINLWSAVAIGDVGLSLAVILNAMRLIKVE